MKFSLIVLAFLVSLAGIALASNSYLIGMCIGSAAIWAWEIYRHFKSALSKNGVAVVTGVKMTTKPELPMEYTPYKFTYTVGKSAAVAPDVLTDQTKVFTDQLPIA